MSTMFISSTVYSHKQLDQRSTVTSPPRTVPRASDPDLTVSAPPWPTFRPWRNALDERHRHIGSDVGAPSSSGSSGISPRRKQLRNVIGGRPRPLSRKMSSGKGAFWKVLRRLKLEWPRRDFVPSFGGHRIGFLFVRKTKQSSSYSALAQFVFCAPTKSKPISYHLLVVKPFGGLLGDDQ